MGDLSDEVGATGNTGSSVVGHGVFLGAWVGAFAWQQYTLEEGRSHSTLHNRSADTPTLDLSQKLGKARGDRSKRVGLKHTRAVLIKLLLTLL